MPPSFTECGAGPSALQKSPQQRPHPLVLQLLLERSLPYRRTEESGAVSLLLPGLVATLAVNVLGSLALGLLLDISPTLAVTLGCVLLAVLLVTLQQRQPLASDTLLGILAHSSLSISTAPVSSATRSRSSTAPASRSDSNDLASPAARRRAPWPPRWRGGAGAA